jgi:hypothetical protein
MSSSEPSEEVRGPLLREYPPSGPVLPSFGIPSRLGMPRVKDISDQEPFHTRTGEVYLQRS